VLIGSFSMGVPDGQALQIASVTFGHARAA
jgi:hypothetical protein